VSEIQFGGETFAVAERIGTMPLMQFAKIAKGGTDSDTMAGFTALYDLLEQCIDPADWQRFQDVATRTRADSKDLMTVIGRAVGAMTDRPTLRPSDSSDGPASTPPNSAGDLSSRVVQRLEEQGRPDQAFMVRMADRSRASA
jgi:hypothetical protein